MGREHTEGPIWLGDNEIVVYSRGRITVAFPRTGTGVPEQALTELAERYEFLGKKVALAVVVREDVPVPNEQSRKEIQEAFEDVAPMTACSSVTVLGSGFIASFFISFHSVILALTSRRGTPQRIFTNYAATARWIHEQLDDPRTSLPEILATLRWADSQVQATSDMSTSVDRTG